jgi:cellulose biosynthesis protein BcsQ
MNGATTAALVGTVGGAGTTRTTVEVAAALAADGDAVAVLDAAYATQGLSDYLPGTLRPDATALVTDAADQPLSAGLFEFPFDRGGVPGRVACCPAAAPFERLARAKRPGAAERFEGRVREAADRFDVVLVDVPPVASNQAVAAVDACERTVLVAPATDRGADAIQRTDARLADLGVDPDVVCTTFGALQAADVALPRSDRTTVDGVPACLAGDSAYAPAVGAAAAAVTGRSLGVEFDDGGLFDGVDGFGFGGS